MICAMGLQNMWRGETSFQCLLIGRIIYALQLIKNWTFDNPMLYVILDCLRFCFSMKCVLKIVHIFYIVCTMHATYRCNVCTVNYDIVSAFFFDKWGTSIWPISIRLTTSCATAFSFNNKINYVNLLISCKQSFGKIQPFLFTTAFRQVWHVLLTKSTA